MNSVALLLGVFLVPLCMLAACHRFRRLSQDQRRVVWGLIIGYGVALPVVLLTLILPPVMWSPDQPLRSTLVYWGLLLMPALGATAGLVLGFTARKQPLTR